MHTKGFTLVEILVVLSVVAILAGVMYSGFSDTRAQERDAERQASLRQAEIALESYRRANNRYPDNLSQLTPVYLMRVPNDPSGDAFVYQTNAAGSVYKLTARGTVESETVTPEHSLAPCLNADGWCSCNTNSSLYQTSYAVWGGFAESDAETRAVICSL